MQLFSLKFPIQRIDTMTVFKGHPASEKNGFVSHKVRFLWTPYLT